MSRSLERDVGGRGKIRAYAMYLAESGKSVDPSSGGSSDPHIVHSEEVGAAKKNSTLSLVVRMETRGLKYFIPSCRVVRLLPLMLNRRLFLENKY